MKKSILKKSIILPLLAASLVAGLTSCGSKGSSGSGEVDDWGISKEMEGPELMYKLHDILLEKHTTYIKYASFTAYTKSTTKPRSVDESAEDSTKNVMFYTNKLVDKSTSYTREHVWACANSSNLWTHNEGDGIHYVDGSTYKGGGSDLYHIRPCSSDVNTKRGNGKFYEFGEDETCYEIGEVGGPVKMKADKNDGFATKVEPGDATKGDIARILMYVYIHYSKIGNNSQYQGTDVYNYLGNLNLANVFNSSYTVSEVQALLVKWNKLDPVDDTERLRNDTVEQIQGNRNPFVDHPEYMARCFSIEE